MRKTLLGLTLLGILTALFGATAPAASAANCTASTQPITRYVNQGYQVMGFVAKVTNCNDVEAVRMWYQHPNGSPSGAFDHSEQAWHQFYLHEGTPAYVEATIIPNWPPATMTDNYTQTCWYTSLRTLTPRLYFQLKRYATHTWGTVTAKSGAAQNVTC